MFEDGMLALVYGLVLTYIPAWGIACGIEFLERRSGKPFDQQHNA